jgi:HEPN domain-containing protein
VNTGTRARASFFGYFEYALSKDDNNEAAFLLHQATERFLTAVILAFGQHKAKTHDLEKLDCGLLPAGFL